MDIREKQNLFRLFIESFSVANRAGAALAGSVLWALLIMVAPVLIIKFLPFSFKPNPLLAAVWGIVCVGLLLCLGVVFIRIICAKIEQTNESVSNAFSLAILPAIYTLIYQLLVGILFLLVSVPFRFIPTIGMLIFALLMFYVQIRLAFAPFSIAVRNQNPISALTYSWQLTSGHGLYVFCALLISAIPGFLSTIILLGVRFAIPTYFADSFNLAKLSLPWLMILIVLAGILILLAIVSLAFLVLVFLNMDYGFNRGTFSAVPQAQEADPKATVFTPINSEVKVQGEPILTPEDFTPEVNVLQASVKTEAEHPELEQHLKQVYQPKQEDMVQYTEEDRMPTILFDDEMAQQLEQERARWEQKSNQNDSGKDDDDDIQSIKMSK